MPASLRVDLHTHTCFSYDGWTSPATLVRQAAARGIDRVAVTDHGHIEGAFAAHRLDPERVIVGEEVRCTGYVDLIGLFLTDRIPDGLSCSDAAERIRAQGGLVYAPHPCAYPLGKRRRSRSVLDVADIVEVANSRAFYRRWNRLAERAARERGLPGAAGSDAHFPWEIGRCHAEMPVFSDAEGLRRAVRAARIVRRTIATPVMPLASSAIRLAKLLGLGGGRDAARTPGEPAGAGP